jgi:hypothetical protein
LALPDGCYNSRVVVVVALVSSLVTIVAAASPNAQPGAAIRTEFRVFDGAREVSADTRLRVRPSGSSDEGRVVEGSELRLDLPPGIYDVQAVRQESGQVVGIRWAERLVIMPYPDEGGRHLEVINFTNSFGALQLRWPDGRAPDPAGIAVTVSKSGEPRPTPARVITGLGYLLLVLPADTYDVRITRPGQDAILLSGVEVPTDRTRMKVIP